MLSNGAPDRGSARSTPTLEPAGMLQSTQQLRHTPQRGASAMPILDAIKYPFGLFVVTRVALLALSAMSLALTPDLYFNGAPRHLDAYPALAGLCRWDCGWFDLLARRGYQDWTETNFWPLYPMLTYAVSTLGIPIPFSLLIVSNAAGLASYIVIYRLFHRLSGGESAAKALAIMAAHPFAFFQTAGYAESLSILLGAVAVTLAMKSRHIAAGTVLGLGIWARHLTVLTGAALLTAQLRERG
jgi:hypothetical protein